MLIRGFVRFFFGNLQLGRYSVHVSLDGGVREGFPVDDFSKKNFCPVRLCPFPLASSPFVTSTLLGRGVQFPEIAGVSDLLQEADVAFSPPQNVGVFPIRFLGSRSIICYFQLGRQATSTETLEFFFSYNLPPPETSN